MTLTTRAERRLACIAAAVGLLLVCVASRGQEAVAPQPVNFTLADVDGRPVRLSNYRGRWVIVNFWATWCGPCVQEIPELVWLQNRHSIRAAVIGVNYESIGTRSLKNFIHKMKINYPVVPIGETPLTPFEPLIGLPSSFFVSPEGKYVARHIGAVSARDIMAFIDAHSD